MFYLKRPAIPISFLILLLSISAGCASDVDARHGAVRNGTAAAAEGGYETTQASSFYVDPVNGDDGNDGSFNAPWKTIDLGKVQTRKPVSYPYDLGDPLKIVGASAPVKPGDTIYLRSGGYGKLTITSCYNSGFVTIAAQAGHTPIFDGIEIVGGAKWGLKGLTVKGAKRAPRPNEVRYNLISCVSDDYYGPAVDLRIVGCTVYTAESISGWTAEDWNSLASSGILTFGDDMTVRGNRVFNVDFGIEVEGDNCLVEENTIKNLCGDGINLKGVRNEVCQYNTVKNHYKTNDNHGDLIQVFCEPLDNTPIYGLELRGNKLIGHEDPDQPYRDGVQGIGIFDNSVVEGIVENNVVLIQNWNGICLYGAVGSRIVNNTVVDPYHYYEDVDHPCISIEEAQNGVNSRDCVVRNNIVETIWRTGADNATIDHNLTGEFDPGIVFKDLQGLDVRLCEGSPAIDAGSPELAPEVDITGARRPQGDGYDIGAYEYGSGGGDGEVTTYYLAEGYTGSGFAEYLSLGNPGDSDAPAVITYLFPDGSSLRQTVTIPTRSRTTVYVNDIVGPDREVSAKIECAESIMVERPMYFDYKGVWTGGSNAAAATAPSREWYFAEGYTGDGFEEYICVLNPGGDDAHLTLRFQTQEAGEQVRSGGFDVPAHSRRTFDINEILGTGYQTSLKLVSDQPVVAERAMYFDYQGTGVWNWTGGHCVMGIPSLGSDYYFAEGTTRVGFEEWLTLQNPGPDSIRIHASYQLGAGPPVEKDYDVPAARRSTIFVPSEVGTGRDVSVHLSSTSLFLAERPMYFNYLGEGYRGWTGGHCVIGSGSAGPEWFFAEGYTGAGFEEWICIQNPGDDEAEVTITYCPEGGTPLAGDPFTVPPGSRFTLLVNNDAGPDLAISAEVTSNQPIVVERPMYFEYGGVWSGGHDAVGYTL